MTHDELNNETEIRQFLLGEMSDNQRNAFEEKFVADEDFFEQIRVAEDELIESYVRGTLPAAEKEKFERAFLTTERRRSRVDFTRAMLEQLTRQKESVVVKKTDTTAARPSVWDSVTDFFKTPKLAFGAAFALLFLIFGGWFLLRNPNQTEITREITPPPTVETTQAQNQILPPNQNNSVNSDTNIAEKPPVNKNSPANVNQATPNTNQNTNAPKQDSVVPPILALFAGTVRGEGKMPVLNLPAGTRGANLQLNLESQDYKIYLVEIVDADGNLVSKNNNLKPRNSKINLLVPAAKLRNGDYIVRLSALNAQNASESVADYTFRVNRR